jgi:cyclopropane fatty-acyl-phospholipid synthase-like methyltransferase
MAIGGEFTLRLLNDAGIRSGMRVLDVGCGNGDVSIIAADLVGSSGSIVGIDRDAKALGTARSRVEEAKLQNVRFVQADLGGDLGDLGLFDAIVGRRVLMYQADTIGTARNLASRLHPGGLIVFQEHDTTMVPVSLQAMPLHAKVQRWLKEMISREGADIHMGFNLYDVFMQAGFSVEHVMTEAIVQTPTQPYPLASIIRAVIPRILAQGVASESEIDIDTLEKRLDRERQDTNATYIADMMFGVWARKAA